MGKGKFRQSSPIFDRFVTFYITDLVKYLLLYELKMNMMKNYLILILITVCTFHIQCKNGHTTSHTTNVSFTVEETDDEYRIFAGYDPEKTRAIESVLDQYLKQDGDSSFTNTQIDAEMTMSNKITFYIKHSPGKLKIELDRTKNNRAALLKFKEMAEQLKKAI